MTPCATRYWTWGNSAVLWPLSFSWTYVHKAHGLIWPAGDWSDKGPNYIHHRESNRLANMPVSCITLAKRRFHPLKDLYWKSMASMSLKHNIMFMNETDQLSLETWGCFIDQVNLTTIFVHQWQHRMDLVIHARYIMEIYGMILIKLWYASRPNSKMHKKG